MEKQEIVEFLKGFVKDWTVEINDLSKCYSLSDALKLDTCVYYLPWVSKQNKMKRNHDRDIIEKNFFVIDLDVRHNIEWEITDQDIKDYAWYLETLLFEHKYLSQWRHMVYTWNGIHIYYVWDFIDINTDNFVRKYSLWVQKVYEDFWEYLDKQKMYEPDYSCKNISRIIRLPWTKNCKDKNNKKDVEILKTQDVKSELVWKLLEMWEKEYNSKQEERIRDAKKREEKYLKDLESSWWQDLDKYRAISKIPLNTTICQDFWFWQWNNLKYFSSDRKKGYEWLVYNEDTNLIRNWWCSAWTWSRPWECYNHFSYVQKRDWLTNEETFKYFVDKYCHIKEIDDNQKEEFKKQKQKENREPIQEKTDAVVDLWVLLKEKTPFSWGLESVDKEFWRYNYQVLNIIVWESWHWKSEFALQQAILNSKEHKVKYLLLEWSKEEFARRRGIKRGWICKQVWDNRSFTNAQKELFIKEYKYIMWLDFLESYSEINLQWLEKYIKQWAEQWVRLFYVDNMDYIGNSESLQANVFEERVVKMLKELATVHNITINLLHHFNKWSTSDRKWIRWSASIKWSSKIEHTSNQILVVYRDYDAWVTTLVLEKDREHWDKWMCSVVFDKWRFIPYEWDNIRENPKEEESVWWE